jgi:SAM-dependent methyltransferase
VLCLASGGGQQGPILAATGARVTVFDNSPAQLERDRQVSEEHDLGIRTVQGDMADLSAFEDASFDLIFHPVSNVFASDVRPVWQECFRVLRPGGRLLSGFMNPALYVFDNEHFDRTGERIVRYKLPFSEARDLPKEDLEAKYARNEPLEHGHSLGDQIGGQLDAGFHLVGFDECHRHESEWKGPLSDFLPSYIATYSVKPA